MGQPRVFTSKDFFERSEVVNSKSLGDDWPEEVAFLEKNKEVVHIFLYYCIKSEGQVEAEGLDDLYLRDLGRFYI
jgi:hypothetical protein